MRTSVLLYLSIAFSAVNAFIPSTSITRRTTSMTSLNTKGFGQKEEPKAKSEGAKKREQESSKYDEIATGNTGGQEYRVYVRQFGSDDKSWLPCGAIAVPRGAQVSDAIYSNEDALKSAIIRTYPKLKGYEAEFEFGFNLKVYPDDPIQVAAKNSPRPSGFSVGNWINTLLSPVDASAVPPPQPPTK